MKVDIKEKITKRAGELITDDQYFLVDVVISGSTKTKISVLIDGDQGVDIDYCASISRQLAASIEEHEWIDTAYVLEVSSPGIDYPLASVRQYVKNIGRRLKVQPMEGSELKGELLQVNDQAITIKAEIKEKGSKKTKEEETTISLADIKKAQVLVSFK